MVGPRVVHAARLDIRAECPVHRHEHAIVYFVCALVRSQQRTNKRKLHKKKNDHEDHVTDAPDVTKSESVRVLSSGREALTDSLIACCDGGKLKFFK